MSDTTSTAEEDEEQEEKSVLYDLWVLAPEWTDTTEPVCCFFYIFHHNFIFVMVINDIQRTLQQPNKLQKPMYYMLVPVCIFSLFIAHKMSGGEKIYTYELFLINK